MNEKNEQYAKSHRSHRRKIAHNAVCQACGWEGRPEDTLPVAKLFQRITPGDIMPYGECPSCGFLAIPAFSMETQEEAARSLMGICLKVFEDIPNRRVASVNLKTCEVAKRLAHFLGKSALKAEAETPGGEL